MASMVSTGSPKVGRKSTPRTKVKDDNVENSSTPVNTAKIISSSGTTPTPLKADTLSNRQPSKTRDNRHTATITKSPLNENLTGMEDILARLRLNDSRKSSAASAHGRPEPSNVCTDVLDKLITNLNDQNKTLRRQQKDLKDDPESENQKFFDHSSTQGLLTPTTDSFDIESIKHHRNAAPYESTEILRVKQELAAAKTMISRQEQELAEHRTLKHTMDQAMGPPSEADFGNQNDVSEQTIGHLQSAFNATARPFTSRSDLWRPQDNSLGYPPDNHLGDQAPRAKGIWNNNQQTRSQPSLTYNHSSTMPHSAQEYRNPAAAYAAVYGNTYSNIDVNHPAGRSFSGSSLASFSNDPRGLPDFAQINTTVGGRRNGPNYRSSMTFSDPTSIGSYPPPVSAMTSPAMSPMMIPGQMSFGPRGNTPTISPLTSEFASGTLQAAGNAWQLPVTAANGQTYVTPLEPMNYRRLLDKSVSCDWKYIVDKIVCNNDQQASIFLQQKLKVGSAEQKFEIVEAIVNQAYALMINRFGNFLVQRCFEHGTPEQIIAIANAIHGNVLSLSMDAFGCHVIQKAFDSVPENHKADMVRELLRRIPDTVIHRYACHVWQKLFELRWSGEPPQIMAKVNDALQGMWHEVALGETGSLVVQNIFENCVEEEKRPAIEEVIANIDLIAHGQFGNWCVQHLCEHGSPSDKRRVIDHILVNSYSYSIDQFASKVVEKCLKIGGTDFLDRYLGVITTAHPDRPRIPLIDIAGDQYGNYLVQWILLNTHHHQREQVAIHVRKHMVSLRGSKFGSRVAMLCCNPSSVTRPGPGALVNPYGAPGQPRTPWPRYR